MVIIKNKVWDLKSFECLFTLEGHARSVKALCVSGQYLFSGSNDKTIKVSYSLILFFFHSFINPNCNRFGILKISGAITLYVDTQNGLRHFVYGELICIVDHMTEL